MPKEMLINVSTGEECRIALIQDGRLEELYMERSSNVSHVGNVYKGKVMNVEASIQAAFIDFGLGRNGFLHISDLMPTYFGKRGGPVETVGRKMARRDRPPIQQCLKRGDEITVQIIKEGLGTKGPTLSSYLSIPGRILVMMPGVAKTGVSRKIEDEAERKRLRKILDELKPPKDVGFIIRTAGVGKSKAEIERDFKYLTRLWEDMKKKQDKAKGTAELYSEGDLVLRTVRDLYTADVSRILVDDKATQKRIKDFFKLLMPRTKNNIELYEEPTPLFHKFNIEHDIEQMHSRTVPLKSGGYLIIDQTEAVVAIDVNSGKNREHGDAETTAFKTDLEAADEIPRQLKLRDLGGVVICDFIDLRFERHRRELEARLADNLKNDRAKTRFLRMSEFGIIEMTRQRMRPSLKRSVFHDCPACKGHGLVKTPESIALDVMRQLTIAAHDERVKRIELSLNGDTGFYVLNNKRAAIAKLEEETEKQVLVKIDTHLGTDEIKFDLFDEREGALYLNSLGMESPHAQGRPRDGGRRGRRSRFERYDDDRDDNEPGMEREETDDDESTTRPPREPDSDPDVHFAYEPGGRNERRDRRDSRDRRDGRGNRDNRDNRDTRDSRDSRDSRDNRGGRDDREDPRPRIKGNLITTPLGPNGPVKLEDLPQAKSKPAPLPAADDVDRDHGADEQSEAPSISNDRDAGRPRENFDRPRDNFDRPRDRFDRRDEGRTDNYGNRGEQFGPNDGTGEGGRRRRRRRRRRRGRGGQGGDNFQGQPGSSGQEQRPEAFLSDDQPDDEDPSREPETVDDGLDVPEDEIQPPHVDHSITSRGFDAEKGARGRRSRRGRGGKRDGDAMKHQRAFEQEQAAKGTPSLAELLRDELKREGKLDEFDDDEDSIGNRIDAQPAGPSQGQRGPARGQNQRGPNPRGQQRGNAPQGRGQPQRGPNASPAQGPARSRPGPSRTPPAAPRDSRSVTPLPGGPKPGSSDKHQLDKEAPAEDISKYLAPLTPTDLDVINDDDYDDDR